MTEINSICNPKVIMHGILNNAYMKGGIVILIMQKLTESNIVKIYKLVTLHGGMKTL